MSILTRRMGGDVRGSFRTSSSLFESGVNKLLILFIAILDEPVDVIDCEYCLRRFRYLILSDHVKIFPSERLRLLILYSKIYSHARGHLVLGPIPRRIEEMHDRHSERLTRRTPDAVGIGRDVGSI
jgi:hypothetical protein